jgi:hypothetical protein
MLPLLLALVGMGHCPTVPDSVTRFDPPALTLVADASGFATGRAYVVNPGPDTLRIRKVEGSCGCANASVQRSVVPPGERGMMYIMVNTKAMDSGTRSVQYTVHTSAGAPWLYTVTVQDASQPISTEQK